VGKGDLFLDANLSKLGLWEGLGLVFHGEANVGDLELFRGVTLLPTNTAASFPGQDEADVSSLFFTQRIGDRFRLIASKINMVDSYAAANRFSGGRGVTGFEHLAFAAPASGIVPPYILGAIASYSLEPLEFTLAVYDPESAVNATRIEAPFDEGVSVGVSVALGYRVANLPGKVKFGAYGSTQDGLDLEDIRLIPPDDDNDLPSTTDGRYFFSLDFEQTLWEDPERPERAFGIFGRAGFSDVNPNPIEWSVLFGASGTGVVPRRRDGRLGAGFFYYGLSRDLQDSLQPVIDLDDEYGGEIFYNAALTPWLRTGLKLQVVSSALEADTAIIGGWRVHLGF
jgi:porin